MTKEIIHDQSSLMYGMGRYQTHDPCVCNQSHFRLPYGVSVCKMVFRRHSVFVMRQIPGGRNSIWSDISL